MIKSSNPALGENTFDRISPDITGAGVMTINGTINKTLILLVLVVVPALWVWDMFAKSGMQAVTVWMYGGLIGGLVFAMVTIFKKTWAPYTAPVYAVLEGLVIGGISAYAESQLKGIVFQAVALTFGTLFSLLVAYRSGIIKVTEKFRLGVVAATGAIFVVYLVSMVIGFFGVKVPFIYSGGTFGILGLTFLILPLAKVAVKFGSP